ncbi:MAG: prepilin peptidase [Balneola sp.]
MVLQVSIALALGVLGSYLSFFHPGLLTENIEELTSKKGKWSFSIFSVLIVNTFVLWLKPADINSWIEWGFLTILYFISVTDLYSKIIPNKLVILPLVLSVIQLSFQFNVNYIAASGLIMVVLIGLNLLTNKYFKKLIFGWGDVKLIGVLSLYSAWEVLWVIYIAILLGGLLSIIGLATKKITLGSKVPFAFFLHLGFIIVHYDLYRSFL